MRHHDLVVIGTGSGNTFLDERFADLDVALVEQGIFGGTCLNVGCIPTKMYVYSADVAALVRQAGTYGVDASIDKIRWADIRDRVFGRIDPISEAGKEYRVSSRSPNVTVYLGHAEFTGPKALRVTRTDGSGTDEISGERVVVATGSRPFVPPQIADCGLPYETSDTVMRMPDLPRRLAIVGGGYIAAEFAHVFSALGSAVTVVHRSGRLLRNADETISEAFTAHLGGLLDLRLNTQVRGVSGEPGALALHLDGGSTVEADTLLVAAGRVPNGDRMNLSAAGIATHPDGRIVVDAFQRTSADGVFALGDVSSPYPLKHVANWEARTVGHNLAHPDDMIATDHRFVPSAVFTHPQLAGVGRTEQECRAEGLDYTTSVQRYGDVAYGWAMEDTVGLCKIIAERGTCRLLGAHLMGVQASSLIQPLIQAMTFRLDARSMAKGQYWIHPALTEVVENALLGLDL